MQSGQGQRKDFPIAAPVCRPVGMRERLAVIMGWLAATGLCAFYELERWTEAATREGGLLNALFQWNADTTLPFLVLLLLPLFIGLFRAGNGGKSTGSRVQPGSVENGTSSDQAAVSNQWLVTLALIVLSFACSLMVGLRPIEFTAPTGERVTQRLFELPPAYHDEYSYLLQARTFLAGRMAWPAASVHPELFHQIHVLNEPTTASRYFPWTGLWMAPFVAMGHPFVGHWLAGALACGFFHRCLRRLMEPRWALVGGTLIALSPGLAVFSNLLLAHHPTLLALSVFLLSFLKLMERPSIRLALFAGTALTLAMLGRPMTAAGFALPFGVWLACRTMKSLIPRSRPKLSDDQLQVGTLKENLAPLKVCAALGFPLLLGLITLAVMNQTVTGSWSRSAYQLYTDTWTPRHRFGFDNVVIGERIAGAKVLEEYDRWATNLTAEGAVVNFRNRIVAESQWTLGIASLLFLFVAAMPACLCHVRQDPRPLLLLLSVITLYAVHVPYWYDGILHWHYVFESSPLLLIIATLGARTVWSVLRARLSPRLVTLWMMLLVASGLLPNWFTAETLWGTSRVSAAVSEQAFSRVRFEQFHRLLAITSIRKPCLVLIDETNSDPQLSYIVNPPDLSGDSVVCRDPKNEAVLGELRLAFPDRALYRFNPKTFELTGVTWPQ